MKYIARFFSHPESFFVLPLFVLGLLCVGTLYAFTVRNETLPKVNGYRTYDLPESTIVCRIEDMRPVKCFLIPRGSLLLVPSDSTNER